MSSVNAPAMIPSDSSQTTANPIASGNSPAKSFSSLPKLPVPKLEDSCRRYLNALWGLQDDDEHERTKAAVHTFLTSGEGAKWQKVLEDYNHGVDSYIEEFWCES